MSKDNNQSGSFQREGELIKSMGGQLSRKFCSKHKIWYPEDRKCPKCRTG